MEYERGFSHLDVVVQCLRLGEEIGELFTAVRKHQPTPTRATRTSIVGTVDEELDVLIYLCSIANRLEINLDDTLRPKE